MIDLRAKPFDLTEDEIAWVEKTKAGLTLDEKIGQLFMDMLWGNPEEEIKGLLEKYGMGGFRYSNLNPTELYHQNAMVQKYSKIPALIAANVESGGNGAVTGGTNLGDPVAIGATGDAQYAYNMGYYGCKEAAAVGCTWTFAPVVDINKNWRNCVVSNRCYGSDADMVLAMSKEYMRGAHDAGLATCMKHFPGDGLDERDQHIANSVNTLSCEEWDASFGKVYKGMIDGGVKSVMIGHIMLPSYTRKFNPTIADRDIMPATVSKELLTDLLRGQLGFNGLIVTDATHMVGLTGKVKRGDFIPGVIAAGCDMILYYRNKDEDMQSMRKGLESGLITMERIDEALTRVLAFKAMLKLPEKQAAGTLMPPETGLACVACEEHQSKAHEVMDKAITLVKNTGDFLPLTPEKHKRIMLYSVDSTSEMMKQMRGGSTKLPNDLMKESLEAAGFEVTVPDNSAGGNGKLLLASVSVNDFVSKFDAVVLTANVSGFSQSNERRLHWSMPMGPDIPWYAPELPTVFVSFSNPFHLIDAPTVPVYVNAYAGSADVVTQVVEKLTGKSKFKGVSTVDAFCDTWDTHL